MQSVYGSGKEKSPEVETFCLTLTLTGARIGVAGVAEASVPLNMMQKWLGHARIETTAICANAIGREERAIAARMWTDPSNH